MTNDVVLSVITPVRNGHRFMAACIEAVALQHPAPFEHIVVDGGSTDGTVEILRRSPGVVWTSGPDRGMYDAINRGIAMARLGDFARARLLLRRAAASRNA